MKKIAKFNKINKNIFSNELKKTFFDFNDNQINNIYNNIHLPSRATIGSAGYDFYNPFSFKLNPNNSIKIPTGICVTIKYGWVLQLFPRSSYGFKYRLQLDNTVGIIDSDYKDHIIIKISNNSNNGEILYIKSGFKFIQGIFIEYGITYDDNVNSIRNGGFGSTT